MIQLVIDTCVLVSNRVDLLAKYRKYIDENEFSKLVTDEPGGPCSLEILKHSPSSEGIAYRAELGYNGRIFDRDIYSLYIGMLKRSSKTFRVPNHTGEPRGALGKELENVVANAVFRRKKWQEWWAKDRMWVSLAQHVSPVDICSFDKGFKRAESILRKHDIGLRVN